MKRLPIGVEDFKELIEDNYYYIDKTDLIGDVLKEKFVLYTRPRRFGKTLNMSMLYYFFSNKEKDNAYLFDGLKISHNKEVMKHQNLYPVIFLSLKGMKQDNIEDAKEEYLSLIQTTLDTYSELFESPLVSTINKRRLNKYLEDNVSNVYLTNALLYISAALKQHYNQDVIILIDEYDVPLRSAYINGFYEDMVKFIKNLFEAGLKTNNNVCKGIFTGCLRISKESIFTGLNHFNVYSIMEEQSSECFGFNQEETTRLLNDYELGQYKDEVKKWYDGYQFGSHEIYNPWSVLKYTLKGTQEKPAAESFWANTSSNDLVYRYITHANDNMYKEFEQLIQEKTLTKQLNLELTYNEMDDRDNVYSFLLTTGYLKCINHDINDNYTIMIPNKEVEKIYRQSFMKFFRIYTDDRLPDLIDALLEYNEEKVQELMNEILIKDISYYDNIEGYYHGFITGLFHSYGVDSNVEYGYGRPDLVVMTPRSGNGKSIIFEFKQSNKEADLKKDLQEAINQIYEKKYIDGIRMKGSRDVVAYAIAFYKKRCLISNVK